MSGNPGAMGCVLGVAVSWGVDALVSDVVAAGMPEHMRPHPAELRLLAGRADDIIHGLTGELRVAFKDEEPGQIVLAGGEKE
jgi:hypothetical protein